MSDEQVRRLRVRRAPRYGAFLITGAVLGVVLAILAALLRGNGGEQADLVGYLAILFGLLGGVIGGGVAVVLDRVRR